MMGTSERRQHYKRFGILCDIRACLEFYRTASYKEARVYYLRQAVIGLRRLSEFETSLLKG